MSAILKAVDVEAMGDVLSYSLIQACTEADLKKIQLLLSQGANPSFQAVTTLYGIPSTTCALLAAADVSKKTDGMPNILRRQAARIIQALLDAGAAIAPCEKQLLETLVASGNEEALALVLKQKGVRAARYSHALISSVIMHHHPKLIILLRQYGVDPNVRDGWGSSPLLDVCSAQLPFFHDHYWAETREKEFWYLRHFTALARSGIDINIRDRVGATPLMRAIVSRQISIARALIHAGADIECRLKNGVATLHLAAACTNRAFMELLMSHLPSRRDLIRMRLNHVQPDVRAFMSTCVRSSDTGPRAVVLTDSQRKT